MLEGIALSVPRGWAWIARETHATFAEATKRFPPSEVDDAKQLLPQSEPLQRPGESVLLAVVFRCCHDPVGDSPDVDADGDPEDRQEEEPETRGAGRD